MSWDEGGECWCGSDKPYASCHGFEAMEPDNLKLGLEEAVDHCLADLEERRRLGLPSAWAEKQLGEEPQPHSLCFCDSGRVYQDCHKRLLRYYVYDHPLCRDLWDVLAYGPDDARLRFAEAWAERTGPGGYLEALPERGGTFEQGTIREAGE